MEIHVCNVTQCQYLFRQILRVMAGGDERLANEVCAYSCMPSYVCMLMSCIFDAGTLE